MNILVTGAKGGAMGALPVAESSDLSEWQRSARDEGFLKPRTFAGHRNRKL